MRRTSRTCLLPGQWSAEPAPAQPRWPYRGKGYKPPFASQGAAPPSPASFQPPGGSPLVNEPHRARSRREPGFPSGCPCTHHALANSRPARPGVLLPGRRRAPPAPQEARQRTRTETPHLRAAATGGAGGAADSRGDRGRGQPPPAPQPDDGGVVVVWGRGVRRSAARPRRSRRSLSAAAARLTDRRAGQPRAEP